MPFKRNLQRYIAVLAQKRSHAGTWALISIFAVGRGCMGPVVMGGVSLILNNSAPRAQLGAVNGFAGTFTNLVGLYALTPPDP